MPARFTIQILLMLLVSPGLAQWSCVPIQSFGDPEHSASRPLAELLVGSDGALYGTTDEGGMAGMGTVFKISVDGTGFLVLHHFGIANGDGQQPVTSLVEAKSGLLYGTTFDGGSHNEGVIFSVDKTGSNYHVLFSFPSPVSSMSSQLPTALLAHSDGWLYGVTAYGGANSSGMVYKINTNGLGFRVLHEFAPAMQGNWPSSLTEGPEGLLYGTTYGDTNTTNGFVYQINNDGSTFTVLHAFATNEGVRPFGGVTLADNVLYGTTASGGSNGFGTLYRMDITGANFAVLHHFGSGTNDARSPLRPILGQDGLLYGTATAGGTNGGGGAVYRLQVNGAGYTNLVGFPKASDFLVTPPFRVVEATNGLLYGVHGSKYPSTSAGDIFRLAKNGSSYDLVYNFKRTGGAGDFPIGRLWQDSTGAFYGSCSRGGDADAGLVYKINPDGTGYQVLRQFVGDEYVFANVVIPMTGVIEGSDGFLYSTASGGQYSIGVLYRMPKTGTNLSILHHFGATYNNDGGNPNCDLIEGSDGFLYGATGGGGQYKRGTLYKIRKDGTQYAIIRQFGAQPTDAATPAGAVLEASDHRLYGTTAGGGVTTNGGTVYSINSDGSDLQILHHFGLATNTEGRAPNCPLLLASDGLLYGTASVDPGCIYKMNLDGSGFTVLHTFVPRSTDGQDPSGDLAEGKDGAIYGTTQNGGKFGKGTIYRVNKDGTGYAVLVYLPERTLGGRNPRSGLICARDGNIYGLLPYGGPMAGILFRLTQVPFPQAVLTNGVVRVSWDLPGIPQSAPSLNGPWSNVSNWSNPLLINPTGSVQFFRIQAQ